MKFYRNPKNTQMHQHTKKIALIKKNEELLKIDLISNVGDISQLLQR